VKLYFLLVRRVPPVTSPIMAEVFDRLRRRGFDVDAGIAEEMVVSPDRLTVRHDLYILKSHTELSLSLAGILHAQGARSLNAYPSCIATQNKIVASRRLRLAGIPAPRSWVTGDLTLLHRIAAKVPLIIKPYMGHRGAGIHIVRNPKELSAVPPISEPVLVQEYIPGTGVDLKVYVVGREVFAVRKTFAPGSFTQPGRPCVVTREVREIALRCGEASGLHLYGLDIIESPQGPVVVDLNYFPGYKGVPDAAPLIAACIEKYAEGTHRVRSSPMSVAGRSTDETTMSDRCPRPSPLDSV